MRINRNVFYFILALLPAICLSCARKEPRVTTSQITNNINNTAVSGGTVTSEGTTTVYRRGVCWNVDHNPTIDNEKTSDGAGEGAFESILTDLRGSTVYYVRAYATNKIGTGYGNEVSFMSAPGKINFNKWLTYGSVTDQEGNSYKTIKIGDQTWMAENMRATHYSDGSPVPEVKDELSWRNTTEGAYSFFSNDTINRRIFGALYNWYAVADSRGLCPSGWHVPSDEEWNTLETFIGGAGTGGYYLKEEGLDHWFDQSTGALNQYGFTAIPAGFRAWWFSGDFLGTGYYAEWWSSTGNVSDSQSAWYRFIFTYETDITRASYWKLSGFSVRCIMN